VLGSRREETPRGEEPRAAGARVGYGTRRAVEALWPSREPVRQQAQVPSKRERRLARTRYD